MEHLGATFDGFCLTSVLAASSNEVSTDSAYEWMVVSEAGCVDRLKAAIRDDIRGCAFFT